MMKSWIIVRVTRNSPGVVQRERRFWRTSQSMTTGCCWALLPEDNDDRIRPRLALRCGTKQKSPRLAPGALFSSRIRCLSPYRNAGFGIRRAKLIHANALGSGRDYQFHPDGIRTPEIRSLGRFAQGVDAVLLLPGGRVGETRQLD